MKFEAKHLLAYAPYDVQINLTRRLFEKNNVGLRPFTLSNNAFENEWIIIDNVNYSLSDIKPILRPISALFIEDENKHSHFDDLFAISFEGHCDVYDEFLENLYDLGPECDLLQAPYEIFEWLVSNHYDVFDLIPNNLAVDINTLPT